MGTAQVAWELTRLKQEIGKKAPTATAERTLDAIRADPTAVMTLTGMAPDPWQRELLRSRSHRLLVLTSRQAGKSRTAAALSLSTALLEPGALVLLLSPSLRQSAELFRKVLDFNTWLGTPVSASRESALTLELCNGSRIVSLPGSEATTRGFSAVTLLVIDEAARVEEDLYRSVRPMLATSGGRLICLTTPAGQQGWFYSEWTEGGDTWEKLEITATKCPRIAPAFLEEERRSLGERWFLQEYCCSFEGITGSVFDPADIAAAFTTDADSSIIEFPE